MTTNITKPKATKQFKALVAVLGSEDLAITAWNNAHPESPIGTPALSADVQRLVDAGFTVEQAEQALATKGAEPKAEAAPLTSQELGEALVEKQGLVPVRGRVYGNGDLIEAQARVLKTGKPEIVRGSGEHRTKAVLVYRLDSGASVAMQNLGEPR